MNDKSERPGGYSPVLPSQADKRAGRRYVLSVPIEVKWGANCEYCVRGVTQDLNDNGVLFRAKADLPVGSDLELTFTVPKAFTTRESYHFRGTVVRTEDSNQSAKSFAVQVHGSEVPRQERKDPNVAPELPAKNACWFGFDVTPRRMGSRRDPRQPGQELPGKASSVR
jgi:hypothetical protein